MIQAARRREFRTVERFVRAAVVNSFGRIPEKFRALGAINT
jgi:hypothetical protein